MSTLARIAIVSALLVPGCKAKSTAPSPSAGSASGSAAMAPPPSPDAAEATGSGETATGSAEGSAAGSAEGSAAADDAGVLQRGMGAGSALREEKLHRLKEKHTRPTKPESGK